MPAARIGEIDIAHATHGDPSEPPLVLIAGLGQQLTMWPMGFVHALRIAGHRVIRFDNRDVGLSTHLAGKLNLSEVAASLRRGEPAATPYRLSDMAADTIGLFDHLDVAAAHVIGISMGGAIAQELAIRHPHRLRSLTCLMATTGAGDVGQPNPTGNRALFRAPPPERTGAISTFVETAALLASPGYFDAARIRLQATLAHDRAFDPEGVGRQLGAIWASGDRTESLRRVAIPTLVIHGDADPLVAVSGGRAIAAAVPDAAYVEIAGLGHDLPEAFWPDILRPILRHVGGTS